MTLKYFLIVVLFLMVLMWIFRKRNNPAGGVKWWSSESPIPYFCFITIAIVLSYWTFVRYAKSCGNPGYYKNVDYHILQQDGFSYPMGQTAWIGSNNPDIAIVSGDYGNLWIDTNCCLNTDNTFQLPLYVGKGELNQVPVEFSVANIIKEYGLDSGDELMVKRGNDTLLWIQYIEVPKVADTWKKKMRKAADKLKGTYQQQYNFKFRFFVNGCTLDSVEKSNLYKGYNLANLLQEGANTRLDPYLADLFGKCYLIRDSYKLDDLARKSISQKIYLFANENFNRQFSVYKNGTEISTRVSNVVDGLDITNGFFFFGLGLTESPVYHVSTDNQSVKVEYRQPVRYHFPSDIPSGEAKLFMTTDIQEIVDHRNDYKCFYQFNEQASENNIYKAATVMNFLVDSAGVDLGLEYDDNVFDVESDHETKSVKPGEEFTIKTMSGQRHLGNTAQVSYLFKDLDMRDNKVYKGALTLYLLTFGLLIAIYIMIHYFRKRDCRRMDRWYIIETSVYLVLIAFLTVRLILLWRLHTFPPIEDVSFMEYNKLTSEDMFNWTKYCIAGVLLLRIAILVVQKVLSNKNICKENVFNLLLTAFFEKLESAPVDKKTAQNKKEEAGIVLRNFFCNKWVEVFLLPIVVYFSCAVVATLFDLLCVVIKEGIAPLLAFAINSMYFVHRNNSSYVGNNNSNRRLSLKNLTRLSFWKSIFRSRTFYCWSAIIVNTIIYLAFLFVPVIGFNEKGLFLPMTAVFAFWLLLMVWGSKDSRFWKWTVSVVSGMILFMVFGHVMIAKTDMGKRFLTHSHMNTFKARLETLVYNPTEMVQNESVAFKGEIMQDILNASSNKWFIDSHLIQRERVAHPSDKVLFDKEYNKLAVSYTTQTRDLLLLRYVIYEHGKLVADLLVCILILLAINVFIAYKRKDSSNELPYLQFLPIHAALFLWLFSAYLLLVNINAVVFVGLDFPFLTLSSKVAPMGLLLPLLAVLVPLNISNPDENLSVRNANTLNEKGNPAIIVSFILILLLSTFPSWSVKKELRANKVDNKWQLSSFMVSMEPLAEFVNGYLNPVFKDWQNSHEAVKQIPVNSSQLQSELRKFIYGDTSNAQDKSPFEVQLAAYAKDHKQSEDTVFIKTAFDNFFQTSLTDTRNLLHIRKQRGELIFVPNQLYYDIKPIFKNDLTPDWEGDLLASNNSAQTYFVGKTDSTQDRIWTLSETDDWNIEEDGKYRDYLYNNGLLVCNIFQIPARYCYNTDKDVFVLMASRQSQRPSNYTIYPKGDGTCPIREFYGIQLLPNDIVKVSGAEYAFSVSNESDYYFSKRIHYNGKHQVIYPLRNRFIFAYNFDQMLAQNYHPDDSATHPVRISLDYELFKNVYDYCENIMRNDHSYGDGIAVTAVDGNGRIRLLADYNPNRKESIDPNQAEKLRTKMGEIYLNGDVEAERELLGNRNVSRMIIGPGSTIKVPFYVALLSQISLDWNSLGIQFPSGIMQTAISTQGKVRDVVSHFGYDKVSGIHTLHKIVNGKEVKVEGWDEMQGEYSLNTITTNSILNPSDFIATSNNFYYGTLLMLGAYDANLMRNGTLDGVLQRSDVNEQVFPKIVLNNNYYCFRRNLLSDIKGGSSLNSQALEAGLSTWFNFKNSKPGVVSFTSYDRQPVKDILGLASSDECPVNQNAYYVYSTIPRLYRDIAYQTSQETFYDNHFNLTAGGASVMEVTPLNMAEMYLRIASMNGYSGSLLTYDDNAKALPRDSKSVPDNFSAQMQNAVYNGMHKVIYQRDGVHNGTLSGGKVGEALLRELNEKGIFIYGKTGTAGDSRQKNNNYHYAFILSNMDLQHVDNRDNLKIYIVYFGYYNGTKGHTGSQISRDRIIHEIINSETFKSYWTRNDNANANN